MNNGTLLLRASIGSFFVGHGTQKLFGLADGPGLKATAQHFDGLGLKPGYLHAALAGAAETGGGLGLLLGYRTPLAASAVVATMTTAIQRVHLKNGWNIQAGGYEYNAVLIAGAVAIAERGPGKLSIDALRRKQHAGAFWGAFALGVGVGGALLNGRVADYFGGGTEADPVASGAPQSPEPATTVEPVLDAASPVAAEGTAPEAPTAPSES